MSFDAGVARPLPGCFLFNVVEEQQLKLNSNYHNKHAVARCLFQPVASFQLFLGGAKFFLETGKKFEGGGSRRNFYNSRGRVVGEVFSIRGGVVGEVSFNNSRGVVGEVLTIRGGGVVGEVFSSLYVVILEISPYS